MGVIIQQLLSQAKKQLISVTDYPDLEAELLLAFALRESRSYVRARPDQVISGKEACSFTGYVARRSSREPMAYITGKREFWSLDLSVNADTLVPRPETELLVESVLKLANPHSVMSIADLGTGSGAIALALAHERPDWEIVAVDVSEKALEVARKNAQQLALHGISFLQGDWCATLPHRHFDVILSNPPYLSEAEWLEYGDGLRYEPREALVSGKEGLDAIQLIIQNAKCYLKSAGYVLIEHGFLQGIRVREIFSLAGYSGVYSIRDLSNQERVTVGCWV